jgi:anaerobic C4-dicarboxylate transporter
MPTTAVRLNRECSVTGLGIPFGKGRIWTTGLQFLARMAGIEIIFAILLVIATLTLLLDRTTPSDEAFVTAIKATFFAVITVLVAAWLLASTVAVRTMRRLSAIYALLGQ